MSQALPLLVVGEVGYIPSEPKDRKSAELAAVEDEWRGFGIRLQAVDLEHGDGMVACRNFGV